MWSSEKFDAAIVGAGVAGTALAKALADRGFSVCIVDKDRYVSPTVLAGELLQPGGVRILQELGMEGSLEGREALTVNGFAVFDGEKSVVLPYASIGSDGLKGYTFHFSEFVNGLRDVISKEKNIQFRIGSVRKLLVEDGKVKGLVYSTPESGEIVIKSRVTILASGRNEKLREQAGGKADVKKLGYAIGVRLSEVELPWEGYGHIFFAEPAPVLAYRIARDSVRVLFDIPGKIPSQKDGELVKFLRERIVPQLPEELSNPLTESLKDESQKLPVMQVLFKLPVTKSLPGTFIIGDSLSTRHPLTGGGMTVALNDAKLLASYLDSPESLGDYKRLEQLAKKFYREREKMAATIDMLSEALYQIFRAEDSGRALLRQAVMNYWERGGQAIAGPMSLLSGISPDPRKLFFHYVSVALLEIGRQFFADDNLSLPERVKNAVTLGNAAYKTISPHLPRAVRSVLPS